MVCLRNAAGRPRLLGGRPLHASRGDISRGRTDTLTTTTEEAEAFGACGDGRRMMVRAPPRGGGLERCHQGLRTLTENYVSRVPMTCTIHDAATMMTTPV